MDDHDRDEETVGRRALLQGAGFGLLAAAAAGGAFAQTAPGAAPAAAEGAAGPPGLSRPKVAMLVHPDMVLLDLVGPQTIFSLGMCEVHLVWKDLTPVRTDVGTLIAPTTRFADCPRDLDVLFAPGGVVGSIACMNDPEVMAFMADRGSRARFVTSVCTGGLVLGAAGLLKGYRATTHWYVRDLLPAMGAVTAEGRVVEDRNRMTAGGVTAGIDFGLTIISRLRDEDFAKRIQLVVEYDPAPPFAAGSPEGAGPEITADILARRAPVLRSARAAAEAAGRRLGT